MFHVLAGALIGAAVGAVASVVVAKVTGQPVTWKAVVAGAVGGAVAGAVTTATLGAGGLAAASTARGATAFIAGGGAGGGSAQVADNAFEGRPLHEGVPRATAVGAAVGGASFGVVKAAPPVLNRVFPGRGGSPGGGSSGTSGAAREGVETTIETAGRQSAQGGGGTGGAATTTANTATTGTTGEVARTGTREVARQGSTAPARELTGSGGRAAQDGFSQVLDDTVPRGAGGTGTGGGAGAGNGAAAESAAARGAAEVGDDVSRFLVTSADGSTRLANASRAVIDSRKLTEYALNRAHPKGGHKARVFESALGYTRENWRELYDQLLEGVTRTTPKPGVVNEFGSRFTLDIAVTGPKGPGVVRTGWIFKPGSDVPELATLLVAPR